MRARPAAACAAQDPESVREFLPFPRWQRLCACLHPSFAPIPGPCCALGTAWKPAAHAQALAEAALPAVEVSDQATADANGLLLLNKTVGTASRLGLTARETPASVHIVDRTAIEARGAQDTQEILRSIPGVTAYSPPGNIGISYRGFGTGSVSQLFNGINLQYSIAARPVDSWIYDRVEAVGGASGFLWRRRRGRHAELHHQAGPARQLHRRPAAPGQLRAEGSLRRAEPPPGRCH